MWNFLWGYRCSSIRIKCNYIIPNKFSIKCCWFRIRYMYFIIIITISIPSIKCISCFTWICHRNNCTTIYRNNGPRSSIHNNRRTISCVFKTTNAKSIGWTYTIILSISIQSSNTKICNISCRICCWGRHWTRWRIISIFVVIPVFSSVW